jgi:phospholipid/cholesterol/gamma-HCH transport system ATP-binding protein
MENVCVSFDDNLVLRDVSVAFEAGLVHGVIGRGGSGRSTLLKVAGTVTAPDTGSVRIFGVDPASCDHGALAYLRREIGFQFQNLGLFDSFDVIDNVLFALTEGAPESAGDAERDRAMNLLETVGLGASARKAVNQLSGGMQRRLAIARAFAPDRARLVLFDDPVGGLDPVTSARILAMITARDGRAAGRTIVISSHETATMMRTCDRLHVIHDGRIAFCGTAGEAARSRIPAVRDLVDSALEG